MPKSPTLAELLSLSQANGIHRLYFPIDWSCLTFKPAFVAGLTLPSRQVLMAQQLQEFCDALVQKHVDGKMHQESEHLIHRYTKVHLWLQNLQRCRCHLHISTQFFEHIQITKMTKQSQTAKMGQHGPKLSKHHNGQLTGAALCHCHQWSPRHRQCLPRPIGCAARCCASRDATRLWRIRSISRQQVHSNWDWYRII